MKQLRVRRLLESPLVGAEQVSCRAPRSGCGAEEAVARTELLVPPRVQLSARLLSEAQDLHPLTREEMTLRLLDALTAGVRREPGRVGQTGRRRVAEVRELLASRPGEAWDMRGLARAVHCSPFHLARQFRAATGESIARYLLRVRLGLALDRLARGEADLSRLALELGFAHQSHFGARFRRVFGITPGEARRQLRTIVTAPPAPPA